ncbi:MAG: MBOAT family protein [Flavobacteriales bacterium]|nr:MBOAT family protein [Flavobacteriales bacterium]
MNWSEWLSWFFSAENLKSIFFYNNDAPLIFTQFFFWAFFAVVLLFYSVVYKKPKLRNAYLFLVSLFFYYKTSGLFISILLFSTLSDYIIGKLIYSSSKKATKQIFVATSVMINLFVLCYFKYAYFFTDAYNSLFQTDVHVFNHFAQFTNNLAGTHFDVDSILLPVGISFYTFQTISYSVDIYREQIKPVNNIMDFGFYVSFFPQLVAGPIVRASEFIPQLYQKYSLTQYDFGLSLFWILKGLIKKVVIGDYIAVNFIDRIFDAPTMYTGFENLMALYGYSLQVYADFSGYTDIAIGIALLMGFTLPTNFNSPYKAKNVGEFWKRWHMSLSTWLRDYLYIPLGGNRGGSIGTWISALVIGGFIVLLSGKMIVLYIFIWLIICLVFLAVWIKKFRAWLTTNINLLITMLLGGLWHGASWQFVIWGGLNGLGLMVYKLWRKISPYEKYNNWLAVSFKVFITLNFITLTRIWFRAESMETTEQIIHQIGNNFSAGLIPDILVSYSNVFIVMLIGYIIHWLPVKTKDWYRETFIKLPVAVKIGIAVVAVFGVYQAMSSELQAFIYFQF